MTVFLSPAEYQASVEKIGKINDRAVKRGFTGRYELKAEPTEKTEYVGGYKVTRHGFNVSVTGEPPKYNGYTLLASLDWEEAGVVVHTAPGVDTVDRDLIVKGQCVHCKLNRRRTKGYLVGDENGQQLQVGSTCLKDFLGWNGHVVFKSLDEVEDDMDWGGGWVDPVFEVLDVLTLSWAVTATFGYIRSGEAMATKDIVNDFLTGYTKRYSDEEVSDVQGRYREAVENAVKVRDWLLSDDFNGDNEYVANLKTIAAGNTLGWRSLGLLASAPNSYMRHLEREADRASDRLNLELEGINEYVGNVGDKIEVWVTVKAFRYIDGHYGTTTLYTLMDDPGHTFKWFSTNGIFAEDVEGRYLVRGTIKNHEEYQGRKATMLTRVTPLNPDTKKPLKDVSQHHYGDHADQPDPQCKFCWTSERNAA